MGGAFLPCCLQFLQPAKPCASCSHPFSACEALRSPHGRSFCLQKNLVLLPMPPVLQTLQPPSPRRAVRWRSSLRKTPVPLPAMVPLLLAVRHLCSQGSPDGPEQYVAVMNSIFSAQRSMVPIDSCIVGTQDSAFLQQASYMTGGVYLKPQEPSGLFQYLAVYDKQLPQSMERISQTQVPSPKEDDVQVISKQSKKETNLQKAVKYFLVKKGSKESKDRPVIVETDSLEVQILGESNFSEKCNELCDMTDQIYNKKPIAESVKIMCRIRYDKFFFAPFLFPHVSLFPLPRRWMQYSTK